MLEQASANRTVLTAGINAKSTKRAARIAGISRDRLRLETKGISARVGHQLAFNFELAGIRYFFVSRAVAASDESLVDSEVPATLYVAENRDFFRSPVAEVPRAPTRVELRTGNQAPVRGEVADWTYHGMGVDVPAQAAGRLGDRVRLRCLDGADTRSESYAEVRHRAPRRLRKGWVRIGLSVSRVLSTDPLPIERHDVIPIAVAPAEAQLRSNQAPAETHSVEFANARGERLSAIVDQWGNPEAATAVVIPPAWGRTKETLLPLAATIVESFRSVGQPIVVMRFDGTRRRGESYIPPDCAGEGLEYLRFTFSQAAGDTRSAIRFLRESDAYRCSKVVLVTFSLSAVEGRRVVARDAGRSIAGWISVVGIADLQSALHVISGGVDYGYGLLRGLRFGRQELFGVLVDIDHSGLDAIENGLSFLEDARRDMAKIHVPVMWIHGRFDAWVDLQRVRSLLSCGDSSRRRLLELPIGHQLRSSTDALAVFCLIASEVGRMSLGEPIKGVPPRTEDFLRQRAEERRRLPRLEIALPSLWREYLLGRDERLGIEIFTATDIYRNFMAGQIALLELQAGQRIADLGSGTGDFLVRLLERKDAPEGLRVHAVDLVREALVRGVSRLRRLRATNRICVSSIVADLDFSGPGGGIPLRSGSFDAVLASLLLSYVGNSDLLLREMYRLLKPGGIVVLSTLRRDADISKIYVDALADRYSRRPREVFGADGPRDVDRSLPELLNAAARIIDLEERGRFRFFEQDELQEQMEAAGFTNLEISTALGEPPQGIVVKGRRG